MPLTRGSLATSRLMLRPWRTEDLPAFAAMNADPRVMEYFPKLLERVESDALAGRIDDHFRRHGFGMWAVEVVAVANFVGFVGLSVPVFEAHFSPCIEVGWRLAFEHWGRGYATEAAIAVTDFAFEDLALDEVVAFTATSNQRSRRVMDRIGMSHCELDDFDHPSLPQGHPLRRHVLYRLGRASRQRGR